MALKQKTTATTVTEEAPKFVSILDQHMTIKDASKEPGLIPSGTWLLNTLSMKVNRLTKEVNGEEVTYEQLMVVHEPMEPTQDVSEEELDAVDENGRSLFDGKRIFTKINLDYAGARRTISALLVAHGYDDSEDMAETLRSAVGGSIKGRRAYGAVATRTWKNRDGSAGRDNEVKAWMSVEDKEAADRDE